MTPAAARQRLYRQRQRDHLQVFQVEVDAFGLIDSLITAGRLGETESEDRAETAAAIARLLADWQLSVARNGRDPLAGATFTR